MEQFATEEQQVEAIKKFWKDNGLAIIAGVVLGLGGLYGWRWYNDSQIQAKEQASIEYAEIVEELSAAQVTKAKAFVSSNDSGYALLTSLRLAKVAVDNAQLDEAATHLQQVASQSQAPALANVANLRLARVNAQLQNYEAALSALEAVNQEAFSAQVEDIRGDIYAAMNQIDKARVAYTASLEKDDSNPLVKMKLDNLAVASNG